MLTAGSTPLTKTFSEARADANWWATPAGTTTPNTLLSRFC